MAENDDDLPSVPDGPPCSSCQHPSQQHAPPLTPRGIGWCRVAGCRCRNYVIDASAVATPNTLTTILTLDKGELEVLEFVMQTLLRGGNPSMATRHKSFASLCRKLLAVKKPEG